jgi:hypothetical protein
MSDRARLSKLDTFKAEDQGASFLGSRDFPKSLGEACKKWDPQGIASATKSAEPSYMHRVKGKRFLVCSGAVDKLVPQRCSEAFMKNLEDAAKKLPQLNVTIDNRLYEGVGHIFSEEMIKDAVEFLVETMATEHQGGIGSGGAASESSKI